MFSNALPLGVATTPPNMGKVPTPWPCSARFAFQSRYPPVLLSDIPLVPALGESLETGHFGKAWMLPVRFDRLPHEAYFAWGFVGFPHAGTHMDNLSTVAASIEPRHPGSLFHTPPHCFNPFHAFDEAVRLEVQHVVIAVVLAIGHREIDS